MGHSAQHTSYRQLKKGVPAPQCGSIELNGKVVAEQTGAESGAVGWGMLFPGEAARAAALAGLAARVTHDGEAVFAAQATAAIVATAFSASAQFDTIFDVAASLLPSGCVIARLIGDIRAWHASGATWHESRERIVDVYGGSAFDERHAAPHFAGVVLALLDGGGDLRDSLALAASAGWGTAANLGLIGCILGVKNGLAGIDTCGAWRAAIDDRLFFPSADAGRCVTDAAAEAVALCRTGRELHRVPYAQPKKGARFHFDLPGSTQGFTAEMSCESPGLVMVRNVAQHSRAGKHCLALVYSGVDAQRFARVSAPTCPPRDAAGAQFPGSPTLYPGQTIRAFVEAHIENKFQAGVRPFIRYFGENDELRILRGPEKWLLPEARHEFQWMLPPAGNPVNPEGTHALRHGGHSKTAMHSVLQGCPIAEVGLEIFAEKSGSEGVIFLDYVTWDGAPYVEFGPPHSGGTAWKHAWVNAATQCDFATGAATLRVCQNDGTGLLIQGARNWQDYIALANITPRMAKSSGLAVRVQGMNRYYALLLCPPAAATEKSTLKLVKHCNETSVLAEADFAWSCGQTVELSLSAEGKRLTARANGQAMFDVEDAAQPLDGGAVALVVEEGCVESGPVAIGAVD